MGLCFSKKKKNHESETPTTVSNKQKKKSDKVKEVVVPPTVVQEKVAASATPVEKKPVFVITQNKKTSSSSASITSTNTTATTTTTTTSEEKHRNGSSKKPETPKKKITTTVVQESGGRGVLKSAVLEEIVPHIPLRTSSCTKEEVDAILIQCGRLSRSSSGKANAVHETPSRKRYSGSKRSYDFDEGARKGEEEDDWEKPVSRPSPRRRTPSRERGDGEHHKRSGSREKSSSGNGHGSRRASRSPGRRSDGPGFTAGDRSKQPGKMVSVPAREKRNTALPEANTVMRRSSSPSVRSQSPANTRASNENGAPQPQSLSQSSSRKAEQSPYRRIPLAELDENSLKVEQQQQQHPSKKPIAQSELQKSSKQGNPQVRKLEQNFTGTGGKISAGTNKSSSYVGSAALPEPEIVEEDAKRTMAPDNLNPRTIARSRSSRRSSRDLDNLLGFNPESILKINAYNSMLLEDILNHQQHNNTTTFTLPDCLSKACSILEAVADLNSDNRSETSMSSRVESRSLITAKEPFLESEIVVKDDILEPSLHKYVTVRGFVDDSEPQESAGSNSFVGQPWTSLPCEPNSIDSTDRCWTSRSNATAEEAQEEEGLSPPERHHNKIQQHQQHSLQESRGRRLRANSSSNSLLATGPTSSNRRRELDQKQVNNNRGSGGGRVSGRAISVPIAAAAST